MAHFQSTYHSRTYRDFKEIDPANYRRIVHFYEKHEDKIRNLDFEERFELLVAYVNALFEVGAYNRHLLMVDVVLEDIIIQNIERHHGADPFQVMLFRKAASLFNLMRYEEAEHVLRELVRIDPYHTDAIGFLKKCRRRQSPSFLRTAKALSIFLFLLAAFVISLEVLFVRPFYDLYTSPVEFSRNAIFLSGCLCLIGAKLWHRFRVERKVEQFVTFVRKNKYEKKEENQ